VLIPVSELKKFWNVNPSFLVHVGAHNAEELEQYTEAGWNQVTWIEAQPSKIQGLKEKIPPHQKLIEAAVWHEDGISLKLNIMTNTESTSLLNLGTHATEHPTVTLVETLEIKKKEYTEQSKSDIKISPEINCIDAVSYLKTFEDNTIDLLITDPPYTTDVKDIKSFTKEWIEIALMKVKQNGRLYICSGAYPDEIQAFVDVLSLEFLLGTVCQGFVKGSSFSQANIFERFSQCFLVKFLDAHKIDG
jgi:hypothetical protein